MKKMMMALAFAAALLGQNAMAQNGNGNGAQKMRSDANSTADNRIGKMSIDAFTAQNKKGGEMVAAIVPSASPLSASDMMLLKKIAMGGAKQLRLSQAVQGRLTDGEAALLASSELEEQTALDAKLKELMAAKKINMAMPKEAGLEAMAQKYESASGANLDHMYVMQSGVANHKKLMETMTMVQNQASDPALRQLAAATLPVIKMHLMVSKDVHSRLMPGMNKMSKKGKK